MAKISPKNLKRPTIKTPSIPKNISRELTTKRDSVLSEIPFYKLALFVIVVNIILIVLILVFEKSIPPEIPLFYGLPESAEQLTTTRSLIIPPSASTMVIIINTTLAVFTKDDFLKKALMVSAIATGIFSSIAVFKVALLVGSF